MNVVIFVTVLFWGETSKPLQLEFLTDSPTCTQELYQKYTKPLRVLEDWKVIISKCEENL